MKKINIWGAAVVVTAVTSASAIADRLDQMISPAFHPVTFEDPRAISEARLLYVHHRIDDEFVTEGGTVNVYALQLRYAVNDRFALIATKDGVVDFNPKRNVPKDNGLADIELGAKYAFYKCDSSGTILTGVLRYLIPTGHDEVFQGEGNGELHPTVSGAVALSGNATLMADSGFRLAMDDDYSSFWDSNVQVDYRIDTPYGGWYPLVGFSLIHVMDAGNQLATPDEGHDFFNFGASGSAGETLAIGAAGLRFRPVANFDLGASFQLPMNDGQGTRILDSRWTFDAIYRF
jgi:hypothetical protein